jgi:tRNA-specific 2-thiouridylase
MADILLTAPENGVSPGQACVIYQDDGPRARVLGGGTIRRVDALQAGTAFAA